MIYGKTKMSSSPSKVAAHLPFLNRKQKGYRNSNSSPFIITDILRKKQEKLKIFFDEGEIISWV